MIFRLPKIKDALSKVLNTKYDYPVFYSPTQQGVSPPCFFIFFTPSKNVDQIGNFELREIGLDIIFVQEPNTINAYSTLEEIVEFLDEKLEWIPYDEGFLSVLEREWHIEDDELHYQLKVKVRIRPEEKNLYMESIEQYVGGIK